MQYKLPLRSAKVVSLCCAVWLRALALARSSSTHHTVVELDLSLKELDGISQKDSGAKFSAKVVQHGDIILLACETVLVCTL